MARNPCATVEYPEWDSRPMRRSGTADRISTVRSGENGAAGLTDAPSSLETTMSPGRRRWVFFSGKAPSDSR